MPQQFGCPPRHKEEPKPIKISKPQAPPTVPKTAVPKSPSLAKPPAPPKTALPSYSSENGNGNGLSAPKLTVFLAPTGSGEFQKVTAYFDSMLLAHAAAIPSEVASSMGVEAVDAQEIETALGSGIIKLGQMDIKITDSNGITHSFENIPVGIMPEGSPILISSKLLQRFFIFIDPVAQTVGLRLI
jgi:hypothetical protein